MKKDFWIKITTSNSVNDDVDTSFYGFSTKQERDDLILERKEQDRVWNHETAGARSFRYTYFDCYSFDELNTLSLGELSSMKLSDFLTLTKS